VEGSYRSVVASLTIILACAALGGCDAAQKTPSASGPQGGGSGRIAGQAADLVPIGSVTDSAHILKPGEIAALKDYLNGFDARTHHEMVVVTVSTLEGRDIEAYALDLANRWGVGRKSGDAGIVVLLALKEKQVRIEVGKGLEDVLTTDYCRHVMELMGPQLSRGQYFEGLMTGVKSIAEVAKASPTT
jgi:uncharacterized protein